MSEVLTERWLPSTARIAGDDLLGEAQARQAAATVAGLVGVPAIVAAGAVLTLFVLTSLVLLAPLVAAVLTYAVWRCNRRPSSPRHSPAATTAAR